MLLLKLKREYVLRGVFPWIQSVSLIELLEPKNRNCKEQHVVIPHGFWGKRLPVNGTQSKNVFVCAGETGGEL